MAERFSIITEKLSNKKMFITNIINGGSDDEHYQVKWFNPISGLFEVDTIRPAQIETEENKIGFKNGTGN